MVRVIVDEFIDTNVRYKEVACLSTDTKPESADTCTGSLCIEVDTGLEYRYDEDGAEDHKWVQFPPAVTP